MNRLLGLLMCAICAGTSVAENLVRNPGFEELGANGKPVGWHGDANVFSVKDGAGRDGTRGAIWKDDRPERYVLFSQRIPAKPLHSYKFSTWVKFDKVQGGSQSARICVEWIDANGKWLGGGYSGFSFPSTKGEWKLLEGMTEELPEKAARVTVSLFADHNCVGEIQFDDVTVEEYVPPSVSALVCSGYRNVYADESIRVHAALRKSLRTNRGGTFKLLAANGKTVREEKPSRLSTEEAFCEIDASKLPTGKYTLLFTLFDNELGKEIGAATNTLTKVVAKPKRKVDFTADNRLLVDGKPFFPLGMYWSGIKQEELEVFAKGPFNCIMPYAEPKREQLDRLHEKNIKVIYSVKDVYAGSSWPRVKTEAEELPYIGKKVAEFHDHPALLGWYMNDELPLHPFRPRMEAHQTFMEQNDPDHPTWVVLYQDPQGYQQTCDVLGIDHYPVPGSFLGNMLKKTRKIADRTFGEKPIWMVPQAMDWAVYKKGEEAKKQRFPTLFELRSMAWQCIAGGANGLIFYSWFDLHKKTAHDPFEKTWPMVCEMANEIKRYEQVMLSDAPAPKASHEAGEEFAVRTWQYNGTAYVLAVNASDKETTTTITFSSPFSKLATDFGPAAKLEGNRITATWQPFEPAIYRLIP
ncbi:MAG: hypothetical protein IKR48_07205 [Kiritimatiellae bacterium]|nr:hypothetical protein [Kiritimatiellia bacterium]